MGEKNRELNPKRVVLGLSGGVDSSVSLLLLKKAGYEVFGVSLKYDTWKCSRRENVCCSRESFALARSIAKAFGANYEIINVADLFQKEVIGYFKKELEQNRTPSPCVFCNPRVKFKSLLNYADKIGAKYIATGHYVRVGEKKIFGKTQNVLMKGADMTKDQSYSLSFLTQDELERVLFPLGGMKKAEVYGLAKENEILNIYHKVKQSQDFCFLNKEDFERFVDSEISPKKGPIIGVNGEKLGEHKGLPKYTIGQRKGIGLPGGPFYVMAKDGDDLVVSLHKKDTYRKSANLKPFNLINIPSKTSISVSVKSRSTEKPHKATLVIHKDRLVLDYKKPVTQLVPGQVAVLYLGDVCIGSGVIN